MGYVLVVNGFNKSCFVENAFCQWQVIQSDPIVALKFPFSFFFHCISDCLLLLLLFVIINREAESHFGALLKIIRVCTCLWRKNFNGISYGNARVFKYISDLGARAKNECLLTSKKGMEWNEGKKLCFIQVICVVVTVVNRKTIIGISTIFSVSLNTFPHNTHNRNEMNRT